MVKRMPTKKVGKKLRRNPIARVLADRVFHEKAVARKTAYKRRPKHAPKSPDEN